MKEMLIGLMAIVFGGEKGDDLRLNGFGRPYVKEYAARKLP